MTSLPRRSGWREAEGFDDGHLSSRRLAELWAADLVLQSDDPYLLVVQTFTGSMVPVCETGDVVVHRLDLRSEPALGSPELTTKFLLRCCELFPVCLRLLDKHVGDAAPQLLDVPTQPLNVLFGCWLHTWNSFSAVVVAAITPLLYDECMNASTTSLGVSRAAAAHSSGLLSTLRSRRPVVKPSPLSPLGSPSDTGAGLRTGEPQAAGGGVPARDNGMPRISSCREACIRATLLKNGIERQGSRWLAPMTR